MPYQLPNNFPPDLLEKRMSLYPNLVSDFAWEREDAIRVIDILAEADLGEHLKPGGHQAAREYYEAGILWIRGEKLIPPAETYLQKVIPTPGLEMLSIKTLELRP